MYYASTFAKYCATFTEKYHLKNEGMLYMRYQFQRDSRQKVTKQKTSF